MRSVAYLILCLLLSGCATFEYHTPDREQTTDDMIELSDTLSGAAYRGNRCEFGSLKPGQWFIRKNNLFCKHSNLNGSNCFNLSETKPAYVKPTAHVTITTEPIHPLLATAKAKTTIHLLSNGTYVIQTLT